MEKRDVKLQVFITPSMDDKLDDISSVMGMTKNEMVRYAIGQLCAGYDASIKIMHERVDDVIK